MVGQNESFMGNFSNSSRGNSDADGIMSTIKSSASSLCEKFQDIISSTVSKLSKGSKKDKKGNQSFISSLINNIDKDLLYATENDDSNLQQLLLNQERLEDSTRAWQDVFFSTWFRRNNKNSNHRNEELLNGISKVKEGLASIGVGSAINNMTNNTTSSFERQLEFIKDIRTELGLTGKQWNNLESVIDSKVYNPLNREFGYIFSQEDKLNSINDLVEMGVRDQGEMVQLMPYMLKWQKVGGDMSADELKYLRPVLSKMGTDSLDAIGDTAAKLSKDFGVSFKDLVTSLNQDKMYNEIMVNSKGNADVFKKSSKSFLGAVTLMKNSFIDSETMTSLLTDLSKKSLADLNESGITQQLALAGLSVQDLKEQVKSGDFMGATNAIIQGLGEFVEQNPDMAENIAGILGYDVDFLNELGLYHDDANANYDKINKSIEDSEGSLDDRLKDLPVSMTERFGNWFNSLSLVKNFMKLMQSLEIGMDDVFYALGILKLLPETLKKGFSDFTTGVVKGFGSFVNDIVSGITDGVGKVFKKINPFTSKMKTPAGSKGATIGKKLLGESDDFAKSTAKATAKDTKKLTGAHPGQRRLTDGSAPKVDDFAPPPSGSGLKGASDDIGRNASKKFTGPIEPPPSSSSYTKPTEFIDASYKSVDDVAKTTTSKGSFSKLFKKGSKSVDDVTKTSSSQGFFSKLFSKSSKSVDDVATSSSKSKSGFFNKLGKTTGKSADGASAVSKAGKTVGKSADDLAKNASFLSKAGSKIGKALGPIGLLVGAGTSAANIAKADDKKKATAKEAGGWLGGAAGGAVAGAAAGSVAGPVGTAIGGIVGGIAGSIGGEKVAEWLYDNFDKIKDKASEVGQWVGDKFNEGWTAIEGVWNTVATWFSDNIWTPISNFASECWTAIEGVWNTVADWFQTNIWDPIANFASDCWTGITDVWNTVADWFQTNIWDPISTFAENAFYFVVGLGAMAWEGIQAVWNTVADWFQTNIWDPLSSAVDAVIQWFKDGFSNAWTFISETWATVTQWFTDTIWTPLTEAVSTTVQWFQDAFNNAWTFISEVWATVTQWFQDTIWTPLTEAVGVVVQWFQDSFNNAWTFISGVWSTVTQWFQDTIWTPVSSAVDAVKTALSNAFSTAWSTIQGVWSSVSSWFSDTIWNPISNTATTIWNAISSTISGVVDTFKSAWGGVSDWFSSNVTGPIQRVWDSTVGAISAGFEKITGWIGGVIEKGKSVVHGSKRTGMVYTPYDGFRAELHKGEVVRSIDGSFSSKVPYDGLVTTLNRGDEVMTAYAVRELERRKSDYSRSDAMRGHSLDSTSRVDGLYNSSVYSQSSSLSSLQDKSIASATTAGLYDLSSLYDARSVMSTSSVSDKSLRSVVSSKSSIASQLSSLYDRISSSVFTSKDNDSSYVKGTSSVHDKDSVVSRLYNLLHYQNLVSGVYNPSQSSVTSDQLVNYSSSSFSSYDRPSNSSASSQSQVTKGLFSPSLYNNISSLWTHDRSPVVNTSSVYNRDSVLARSHRLSSLYDMTSATTNQVSPSIFSRDLVTTGIHNSSLYDGVSSSVSYGKDFVGDRVHDSSSYDRSSIASKLLSLYDRISSSVHAGVNSLRNSYLVSSNLSSLADSSSIVSDSLVLDKVASSSLRSTNLVDSNASSVYGKASSSPMSRAVVAPSVSNTRSLVATGVHNLVDSSNSNLSSIDDRNLMSTGLYDLSSKSRSVIMNDNSVRSSVTAPSARSMSVLDSSSSTIDLSTMDSLLSDNNNSMLRSTRSESKSSSYSNTGGMGATSIDAMNNYFDKVAKYIKVSLSASSENSTTSTNSNNNSVNTGSSNSLVDAARSFKGAKYVWGGKEYPSLDCSGLVASAFEKLGWVDSRYKYNNNAQAIRSQSSALSKSSAGAGDLAFLVKGGEATHIGIVSGTASNGNHTVVHSSSGHGGYAEESNSTYWNAWGRFSKATGTTSSNARTTTVTGGSPKGTASQVDFIKMLAPGAVKSKSNGSTLPSVTMSQGILESGWGKSSLATKAKNLFGIKVGSSWKGKYVEMPTTEYSGGKPYKTTAKFRAYDSFSDSIEDHGNLLKNNSRYSSVISAKTYKDATKALSSAGYATDPNYPSLLNNIIEDYNLSSYDGATVDNSVGDTATSSSGTDAKPPKVTVNVENAELVKTLRWQVAELTKAYANANKPTKSSSRQSNAVASIFEFA